MVAKALAALAAGTALASCQPCPNCLGGPALEITVRDCESDRVYFAGAVSGFNEDGSPIQPSLRGAECGLGCEAFDAKPGRVRIDVSAEGYAAQSFSVEVVQDGCGLQDTARREVRLCPLVQGRASWATALPDAPACR